MKTLEKAVIEMQNDGGEWRKVEFYTKSSTDEVFTAIKSLNGLANVAIFQPEIQEKWLTVERPPKTKSVNRVNISNVL